MPVTPHKNSWKPLTLRRYRHVNFDKSQRRRGARIAGSLRIALTIVRYSRLDHRKSPVVKNNRFRCKFGTDSMTATTNPINNEMQLNVH